MKVNRDSLPRDVIIVVVPVTGRVGIPTSKYIHVFNFAGMSGDKLENQERQQRKHNPLPTEMFSVVFFISVCFFPGNQDLRAIGYGSYTVPFKAVSFYLCLPQRGSSFQHPKAFAPRRLPYTAHRSLSNFDARAQTWDTNEKMAMVVTCLRKNTTSRNSRCQGES